MNIHTEPNVLILWTCDIYWLRYRILAVKPFHGRLYTNLPVKDAPLACSWRDIIREIAIYVSGPFDSSEDVSKWVLSHSFNVRRIGIRYRTKSAFHIIIIESLHWKHMCFYLIRINTCDAMLLDFILKNNTLLIIFETDYTTSFVLVLCCFPLHSATIPRDLIS